MPRSISSSLDLRRLPALQDRPLLAYHLVLPTVAAVLVGSLLMQGGGDQWLADHLLQLEGGHWRLRDAWATSVLVHEGGKWLSTAAALLVMLLCFHQWRHGRDRAARWALLYLVLAVGLATGTVSLLKHLTQMDCPWDLARYGGDRAFVGLLQLRPHGMPAAACFPAGHASAGYAWVSLYFFALLWRPALRWRGLAVGLAAGLVFGIAQQLRGAHFLSHDVYSLLVCWLVSLALFVLLRGQLQRRPAIAQARA